MLADHGFSGGMRHDSMLVDCARCPARGLECDGCMVTALLDGPSVGLPLEADERNAVSALVSAGLVTPQEAGRARARTEPVAQRRVG